MAGSGRARRFRQARELKQGRGPEMCSFCRANLGLGEAHDPGCDYAGKYVDSYAEGDEAEVDQIEDEDQDQDEDQDDPPPL